MDLITGWDFSRKDHQEKAMEYVEKCKPRLVVWSPMCTMFSSLQNLSAWTPEKEKRWREDRRHLEFVGKIYEKQVQEG